MKFLKLLVVIMFCAITCSCSTPYKESSISKLDNYIAKNFLKVDIGDKDPGDRISDISNALYDRYDHYTLIYFYRGNQEQSVDFSALVSRYAKDAWLKIESYTLDAEQLPAFHSGYDTDVKSYRYIELLERKLRQCFGGEFMLGNGIKQAVRLSGKANTGNINRVEMASGKVVYQVEDSKYYSGTEYLTNLRHVKTPALFLKVSGDVIKMYPTASGAISRQVLVGRINKIAEELWESLYEGPKSKRSFAEKRYP